eukprot:6455000-Amphidinium_carterae.1
MLSDDGDDDGGSSIVMMAPWERPWQLPHENGFGHSASQECTVSKSCGTTCSAAAHHPEAIARARPFAHLGGRTCPRSFKTFLRFKALTNKKSVQQSGKKNSQVLWREGSVHCIGATESGMQPYAPQVQGCVTLTLANCLWRVR